MDWTINNVDILGVLDSQGIGSSSMFLNSRGELQFYIRPISNVPEQFVNVKWFTGFASRLREYVEDDAILRDKDALTAFLEERVLIFKVQVQRKSRDEVYYVASDIRVRMRNGQRNTFFPAPMYSAQTHGHSFDHFQRLLMERRPVGRIDNIASGRSDTPEFVLWQHEDGSISVFGPFQSHEYIYGYGGFRLEWSDSLRRIGPFRPDWLDDCYDANGTVLFIPWNVHHDLGAKLLEEGSVIASKDRDMVQRMTPIPPEDTVSRELQFLSHFCKVVESMGLNLSPEALCNFHVSMKSSALTILAGLSGTGKSKLVHAYAKALGPRHQLKFIAVQPSWTDSADLLGYVDLQHMVYRPADNGLVDILVRAARREQVGCLYIICLDEMNLARVEHYFSQFLSVLERDPGERRLTLYNKELQHRLYNGDVYPPEVEIGDNVLFVGTVNLDESTHHFSDKVLDRANVIELDVLPFRGLKSLREEPLEDAEWTAELYNGEFRRLDSSVELTDRELDLLWDLHEAMQQHSRQLGVGLRTVRQIDVFLKNVPDGGPLSREEAFDRVLCQRVFTKLRGPADALAPLLRHSDDPNQTGRILSIMDSYRDLGEFPKSRQLLKMKWAELELNGYTV